MLPLTLPSRSRNSSLSSSSYAGAGSQSLPSTRTHSPSASSSSRTPIPLPPTSAPLPPLSSLPVGSSVSHAPAKMRRLGSFPSLTPLSGGPPSPSSAAPTPSLRLPPPPSPSTMAPPKAYPPPGSYFYGDYSMGGSGAETSRNRSRSKSISTAPTLYSPLSPFPHQPLPSLPQPPRRNPSSPRIRASLSSLALSSLTPASTPPPPPQQTRPLPSHPRPPHRSHSSPSIHVPPQDHYQPDYLPSSAFSPSSPPLPLQYTRPIKVSFTNTMTRRRSAGAAEESDGEEGEEEEEEEDGLGGGLKFQPRGGGAAGIRARWEAGSGIDAAGLGLMGVGGGPSGGGGGSFSRSRFGGGERSADERDVNILSTDGEEPLPTSLLRPPPTPSSRLAVLASTPLVLLLLRLLSVVPSVSGTAYLLGRVLYNSNASGGTMEEGSRMECFVACFWSLLTATQCFLLTSGLTRRWLAYYSLPSTLLRLLSLQTICWPATSLTLRLLGPSRPLVAWVVIGTTTAVSNSIRLWVTSNIPAGSMVSGGTGGGEAKAKGTVVGGGGGGGRRTNKRRMDWGLVVRQCVWPCLVGYMFTSWCLLVERDYARRDSGFAKGFGE